MAAEVAPEDASIGELVRQLFDDSGRLVRAELRLAQAEFGDNVRAAVAPIAAIAVGAVFLMASMLTLLAAVIGWLTPELGAGNAAAAVTLGAIAIGGLMIAVGAARIKKLSFTPDHLVSMAAPSPEAPPADREPKT